MSKENKFRYVFKCSECGDIIIKEYTLHGIQFGYVDYPEHVHGNLRFGYGLKDILQFTCRHDKNNNEFYEGDIVKHTSHNFGDAFGVVCFKNHGFHIEWFKGSSRGFMWDNYEVVGDKYNNPELMDGYHVQ